MTNTLRIIAAACSNNGIGSNGQLPWHLKKEMAFFKKMTTSTENPEKQNAVIMGRKTWFSIPEKLRPLPNRINIVLTTTQLDIKGPDCVTDSFDKAIDWLNSPDINEKVEKVFVIGGEAVYKIAMDSDHHQIIYLTRVQAHYDCDAFFPIVCQRSYRQYTDPNVPQEVQEENGIKYQHEVYVKRNDPKE